MQREKTKMAKLSEAAPKKPLFEGYEKTSKEDKEELAKEEKEIEIIGYAELDDNQNNKKFGVCLYNDGEKVKTMTISNIQLDRLKQAEENVGLNEVRSNNMEKFFTESILTTFKLIKSSSSANSYYVFE